MATKFLISALLLVLALGCGSKGRSSGFSSGDPGTSSGGEGPSLGSSGGGAQPCTGLCLQQKSCPNGGTTSVSGTVYDPAGQVPLYNVVVYVPNAPLDPITSGASCDKCGTVSGDPLVSTLTDSAGNFKLTDMPAGQDIPLVLQVGKWRRQITLPTPIPECVDTKLDTPALKDLTRMPKNHDEGDIPRMALTTGGADVLECLLRRIGIEDSEFSTGGGNGRVHFYAGMTTNTQLTSSFDAAHGGQKFGAAANFWVSVDNLAKYDIVLLSCEGQTFAEEKPQGALQALVDYTNAGGRVFASHWHRYWFHPDAPAQSVFTSVGAWADIDPDPPDPSTGVVDTSFPKGLAMQEWLVNVGASRVPGEIDIHEPRDNIASVDPSQAQQWITIKGLPIVEYLSFNTPQSAPDDQKCGRVVYSDLHVSSGEGWGPWPSGCTTHPLSAQEKALEFMLFDLSSCILSDHASPEPPVR